MRLTITALTLIAATFTSGLALATPNEAPAAPRAPTPMNADKTIRPMTPAVAKTPTVSVRTAALSEQHDNLAKDPSKPIPSTLRAAKQEVLLRNQDVSNARTAFRQESATVEGQATSMAHPTHQVYNRNTGRNDTVERPATPTELAQASETFVSAAQLVVKRSGGLSERVAKENPDTEAKVTSAKEMATDYRKGAALYRESAVAEDRRAEALTAEGKLPEAQIARDKAHNTRTVADRLERQATELESNGIPGADALTIPKELHLSKQ